MRGRTTTTYVVSTGKPIATIAGSVTRARAVEHITERLKSHDMPAAYLAAALFPHIEEIFDRRLEGMVRAYVALCLSQARVYGEVKL